MSKSLKNFITIKEFIKKYTARQIRMVFLINKWWMPMTYSLEGMEYAVTLENKLFTFVSIIESKSKEREKMDVKKNENSDEKKNGNRDVKNERRDVKNENRDVKNVKDEKNSFDNNIFILNNVCFNDDDKFYFNLLEDLKNEIHTSLCDNIDTSLVIKKLFTFISTVNQNIEKINFGLANAIKEYFNKLLRIFGLIDDEVKKDDSKEEKLLELINGLRNDIRDLCKKKSESKEFFGVCDKLRDDVKKLGYIIEDKGDKSIIRKE